MKENPDFKPDKEAKGYSFYKICLFLLNFVDLPDVVKHNIGKGGIG